MNLKVQLTASNHQFFHIKTINKNKHTNEDNVICTAFVNTKECIFIFVFLKNAIDCIIIEIPLNEIMPEHSAIDRLFEDAANDLHPRVTSKSPYTKLLHCESVTPNGLNRK